MGGDGFAGVLTLLLSLVYVDSFTDEVPIDEGRLVRGLAQVAIVSSRGAADVRYDEIVYDDRSRTISIEGLSVAAEGVDFEVAGVRFANHGSDDHIEIVIGIDGLRAELVDLDLPPPVMLNATLAGLETIVADGEILVTYDVAQSASIVEVALEVQDAGRMAATIDVAGLHVIDDGWEPRPAGEIERVSVSFENLGLSGKLLSLFAGSPQLSADQASFFASQAATVYLQALAGAEFDPSFTPDQAPPAAQESAARLEAELTRFLIEQDSIAITVEPETPLSFTEAEELVDSLMMDPGLRLDWLQRLTPTVSAAPVAQIAPISGERLTAAAVSGYGVQPDESLALAEALLLGEGAPRNIDLAIELASGAIDSRDPRAMLILARAKAERGEPGDLSDAYGHALLARHYGADEAGPVLTALEAELSVDDIIAQQAAAIAGFAGDDVYQFDLELARNGDAAAMRRLGLAYEAGVIAPRNYLLAYQWALLGAAAGDRPALRLRDRMAARFERAEPAQAAVWSDALREAEAAAYSLWTDGIGAAAAAR